MTKSPSKPTVEIIKTPRKFEPVIIEREIVEEPVYVERVVEQRKSEPGIILDTTPVY